MYQALIELAEIDVWSVCTLIAPVEVPLLLVKPCNSYLLPVPTTDFFRRKTGTYPSFRRERQPVDFKAEGYDFMSHGTG